MFPLITWKEQAICLQKLQAVVITFSLLNFLEEYLRVKRTLTTLISLRCLEMCMGGSYFFQDAFTKCVHMRKFLDIQGPELHCGHKNNISLHSDLPKKIDACPQCV